ncbi:MAG: transglutaminase family protein, partial [Planctomycetes bacterium]|nr:transglutaminase family protein [Planctomycetota bacterium]
MTYRRVLRTLWLVPVLVGLARAAGTSTAPAGAIDLDNPPRGVFSDEWYVLMLNDSKSGHMHTTMERTRRSGRDVIRTKMVMTIEVARANTQIALSFDQTAEETLDGRPLSFRSRMQLGKIPSITTGIIDNGKVAISTTQFGLNTGTDTYDLPEGAIMSWGTYREQIKRGLKPGLEYELSVYEPTISPDQLTRTTVSVLDQETIDLFGRKVTAYRTRQTAHIKGKLLGGETAVDTVTWMTDAGTVVKMRMSVPPIELPFEVIACPKAVALSRNEPTELMVSTLLRVDRALDNERARTITYRLLGKGGADVNVPETGMQRFVERRDGTVTLQVTRRSARAPHPKAGQAPGPAAATSRPAVKMTRQDLAPFLQSSADLNFKDPVVADLARKAAGGEKDPNKLAERLCRFVHDYVQTKNLSIGFATASEVARSREGDCTEHGVLLAALGRAVGIPTRIVTGIVYTDEFTDQERVFVGHLWTQFWLDGEWVDLDAAFGQVDVDPTHIALGVSTAGDGGLADLVTSGWLGLGKLSLKV